MKVDGRKLSRKRLEEIRFEAVKRVHAGESPAEVAKSLGVYENRVYVWLATQRAGGWDALRSRKRTGRPKKLSAAQIRWIYNAVTMKEPRQFKLPFGLWTRAQICALIFKKFGIRLSVTSVGRLLSQLGLSCQKPLFRAYQQDTSLVERWLKHDYPKIKAQAKAARADIFFEDESGVRSDFHSGTTWAIKGKTPIVRVTGQRFGLNMISAISPRGELRFMVVHTSVNADVFIEFLKRLIHGRKRPIFLIVDGHPTHRAKKVKAFVESLKGKLRLFTLPAYSPELNPDEQVWNDVKNNGVARSMIYSRDDLKKAVGSRLRHLQKSPSKVRAFFRHPECRYAA